MFIYIRQNDGNRELASRLSNMTDIGAPPTTLKRPASRPGFRRIANDVEKTCKPTRFPAHCHLFGGKTPAVECAQIMCS
jgi:hypothetical protein